MQTFSNWLRRVSPVLLVAGIIILFDQWTKLWVRDTIPKFTFIEPIPGLEAFVVFEHVDNYGAAFGILQNFGGLFVVIAALVSIAIIWYAGTLAPEQRLLRVLLGLQLGGALGNAIDRVHQGFVTDFIKTGIPGIYYIPNYNIADSAIVVGVIGLGIYIFWDDYRQQQLLKEQSDGKPNLESDMPN